MKPTIKIQYRPIESLIPYARNAKLHSDAHVAQIAASITEFGWGAPILVDGQNNVIAGHGRLLAARKLNMTEVPVVPLEHLSETQRRALILADNKIGENASWEDELLGIELADLKDAGFDLGLTGFSASECRDPGLHPGPFLGPCHRASGAFRAAWCRALSHATASARGAGCESVPAPATCGRHAFCRGIPAALAAS